MCLLIELNKWMEELDRRHRVKLVSSNSCTPSKVRQVGAPSTFVPPKDAPKWAVDPTYKQSKLCMAIYRLIRKIVPSLTVRPFTKHHHVCYSVINISISVVLGMFVFCFLVASRKLM